MKRNNRVSVVDRILSFGVAGLVFILLGGFLFSNFNSDNKREVVEAHDAKQLATIAANTVSEKDIQQQKDKILQSLREREELQKQRQLEEQKKLDEIKAKQLEEKELLERLKQRKIDERKAISLANKKKLEQKKKLEKKKKEEARRARELAKKKAAEKKHLEEMRRKAVEELRNEELESALASELNSEVSARKTTTLVNRYAALISNKLQANFITPVGASKGSSALVNIHLNESGNVLSSKIVKSSGNIAYDQAVLAAVGKSSPLPLPAGNEQSIVNALKTLRNINLRAKF